VITYGTEDLRARIKAIHCGQGSGRGVRPGRRTVLGAGLRDMAWNGRFLVSLRRATFPRCR